MNLDELVERVKGHTPGPFHVAGLHGEFVNDAREANLCRVNPTVSWNSWGISQSDGPDSHKPNTELFAAAPSLLTLALELKRENEELRAELKAKGARIVGMENVKHIRGGE